MINNRINSIKKNIHNAFVKACSNYIALRKDSSMLTKNSLHEMIQWDIVEDEGKYIVTDDLESHKFSININPTQIDVDTIDLERNIALRVNRFLDTAELEPKWQNWFWD